ncbi:uncharacterized protein LOC123517982 [Portunus trituberculatus]|uniref:uncharacterized protein LOC123517982 n=1 Tax=Portunus trituberculatus TaxID=210409 RepID=UPI001E1CC4ED|nr:uncharacterized protein LOC123517982 [Portunus trituberculatus]
MPQFGVYKAMLTGVACFPRVECPASGFIRRGSGVTSITVCIDTAIMKTCTLLGRPLLLVAVLAVSWAAAVPLQDTDRLQDIHSEEQLQAYLESNPSVLRELYPDLLREASEVLVVVDPDTLVEMLREQAATATHEPHQEDKEEEEEEEEEEEAQEGTQKYQEDKNHRSKRQVTFGVGMNRGSYGRDYNANIGYERRFNNGRSSFGVHANKNWGASGRSHGFGISFSHRFGR